MVSAYGKDNAQIFVDSSEIIYKNPNKKRVSDWESITRLQLPVIDTKANSNDSIFYSADDVNKNVLFSTISMSHYVLIIYN